MSEYSEKDYEMVGPNGELGLYWHDKYKNITMSTCKSCGAEIKWVKMQSGKVMPVDIKPEKRILLKSEEDFAEFIETYTSHFATCPYADQHRKK